MTITIADFTDRAEKLNEARSRLAAMAVDANDAVTEVRAKYIRVLEPLVADVAALEKELLELAEAHPALFKKPQSFEHAGVRFGWRKGAGRLELPDVKLLLKRMGRLLTKPQRAAIIKVEVKVLKGPLKRLSGELLQKLGVNSKGAGPEAFVSYPKSGTDKLIDWLLKPLEASAGDDE